MTGPFSPKGWPAPWRPINAGEGPPLEAALAKLTPAGHPLHEAHAMAIAVRHDGRSSLFAIFGGPAALVELRRGTMVGFGGERLAYFDGWPAWQAQAEGPSTPAPPGNVRPTGPLDAPKPAAGTASPTGPLEPPGPGAARTTGPLERPAEGGRPSEPPPV